MTPRTDREIWWVGFKPDEKLEAVWADFARDLEKENAELRKALREIAEASGFDNIGNWARNKAKDALKKEAQP